MKTSFIKTSLALAALWLLGGGTVWADEGTDDEYTAANSLLRSGCQYRIYTTYEETKYYLKGDGSLTTTKGDATTFTMMKQTHASDSWKSDGWYVVNGSYKFTNCNASGGPSANETIRTTSSYSREYEEQVFFLKDGKYAIRSTNSTDSNYGTSSYWTVASGAAPTAAIYNTTMKSPDYIWEVELVSIGFDAARTYYIRNANSEFTKTWVQATSADNQYLALTDNESERAKVVIMNVQGDASKYVLYDVVGHKYIIPKGKNTQWEVSPSNLGVATIADNTTTAKGYGSIMTDATYYFTISNGTTNGLANTNNSSYIGEVAGWSSDNGSQWIITETGETFSGVIGINPNAVYQLHHNNTTGKNSHNAYMSGTPDGNSNIPLTNTDSEKGQFILLPVSGQNGSFYLVTNGGYYVTSNTSSGGAWTFSNTTPAIVTITANPTYCGASGFVSGKMQYLIGTDNHYANPQGSGSISIVKTYNEHENDRGNNWMLDAVSDATATLPLTALTTGVQAVVESAVAAGVPMSYVATVTDAGFSTMVVPFSTDALPGGVQAWSLSSVDGENKIQGTSLSNITANEPVLLKKAGTYTFTSNGTQAWSASPTSGLLTGVYVSGTVPADSYVLQKKSSGVAFFKVESGKQPTINPFRAYLTTANSARQLSFDFLDAEGETTGIAEVNGEGSNNNVYYDLQGRRVAQPKKGLYVKNGKKVLMNTK